MSTAFENADTATADVGMVWMDPHPLRNASSVRTWFPRTTDLDQRNLVVLVGQQFSPGLATDLQL